MYDRRLAVGFDPDYFAHEASTGRRRTAAEAFRHAVEVNLWSGSESLSGSGSTTDQTALLARSLPTLLQRIGVRSVLDLPCGDGLWMSGISLPGIQYLGADLLPEMVERAAARMPGREFYQLDLTLSPLPRADLMLCRDCLVHLSASDIWQALANLRLSGIVWLLTTTFPDEHENRDVITGDWRPLNLERPPFSFPSPVELLREGCTEQGGLFADKSLGLWRVSELPS